MEIALAGKTVDSASVNSDINDDSAPLNANSDGECNESKGNNISLEAQKSGSKEKDLRLYEASTDEEEDSTTNRVNNDGNVSTMDARGDNPFFEQPANSSNDK